ncbi:MAG TPA: hypothetical protein DEP87_04280 [Candidatus Pacebacteria bacterium]|nr:hypothetical protein [Candidatus Paceibacterota bacterium]
MKTVIFSDTHFDPWFEPKKYAYLARLIQQADQVIINGDLWESILWTFDEFIKSPWSGLFSLLKAKKTIYIYGNHDAIKFSDERVQLFSTRQVTEWKIQTENKHYLIQHGDQYDLTFHKWSRHPIGKILAHNPLIVRGMLLTEKFCMRWLDIHYSQNQLQKFNQEIKQEISGLLAPQEILITGHTHSAEIDEAHQFANSGFIRNGLAQYLEIDVAGALILHEDRY